MKMYLGDIMKNNFKNFIFLLIIISSIVFYSCDDGEKKSSDSPPASDLTLNKSSLSLLVGNTFQLIASKSDVSWASDDLSIAEVDTAGNVSAKVEGVANITATTNDNLYSASCAVTVTSNSVSVTGVSLNMTSTEIIVNGTVDLNETVIPANATNPAVTWSTTSSYVATVDSNGVVTGNHTGTAKITVKTVDGNKTAQCSITVKPEPVAVTDITLDRTEVNVFPGLDVQLTPEFEPSNATNKNITWASSDNSIAEVTSDGLITGKISGEIDITVTTEDGSHQATCHVVVDEHPVLSAGYYSSYPCYWINTTIYNLETDNNEEHPKDIIIENGNIYFFGGYDSISTGYRSCYWINNELHVIPKPSDSDGFNSDFIKIFNGDIYYGGYYRSLSGNDDLGIYWINDTPYKLPFPGDYEISVKIYFDVLDNGDVFSISGIYSYSENKVKVCYWINQEYHELSLPADAVNVFLNSYYIENNNAYITVDYDIYESPNMVAYKKYFINDTEYDLKTEDNTNVGTSDMQVVNGKVYITGEYTESGTVKYCVWEDKVRTDLPVPNFSDYIKTDHVEVSNGSIYVRGSYKLNSNTIPCYWIGSTRYDLTSQPYDADLSKPKTFISNSNIYIGYGYIASYWINSTEYTIDLPNDYDSYFNLSFMDVQNSNVYILGNYYDIDNNKKYCYWINNTRYNFDENSNLAFANTIIKNNTFYNFGYVRENYDSIYCYWINTTRYDYEKFRSAHYIEILGMICP